MFEAPGERNLFLNSTACEVKVTFSQILSGTLVAHRQTQERLRQSAVNSREGLSPKFGGSK